MVANKKLIIFDPNKCVGCRVCEAVCTLSHEGEINPLKARIKVIRDITDLYAQSTPSICLQCEKAICEIMCPTNAIIREKNGILHVDENRCIGCRICLMLCPFGAVRFDAEKNKVIKCDLCYNIGEPLCVKYCYAGALQIAPVDTLWVYQTHRKAHTLLQLLKELKGEYHL